MGKKQMCSFYVFMMITIVSICVCGSNESGDEKVGNASINNKKKILRIAYNREIDVLNPFTSQNLIDIE